MTDEHNPDAPRERDPLRGRMRGETPTGGGPSGSKILRWALLVLALVVLGPPLLDALGIIETGPPRVAYTEFLDRLSEGRIETVTVQGEEIRFREKAPSGEEAEGDQKSGADGKGELSVTYLPSFGDDDLLAALEAQGVAVQTRPRESFPFWMMLLWIGLPILLIIGLFASAAKKAGGAAHPLMQMGRSRAKPFDMSRETIGFDDVAGAEGAKAELGEVIEFLRDPDRFRTVGGKPPKGVLLVGAPGTGKTLLARAVAGEAHVPFFNITGSDFMEMFVGVGASRVRDLFRQARNSSPSIVFIDELDSIGRQRGAGLGGGHDEREQTLNQMLSEMDGFEPNEGVIVIAASNRPDILDPALLRPGRFDRRIVVELPSLKARRAILEIHARGKPFADDVDLGEVARGTPGFSGADLENLLNEAALIAGRKQKSTIESEDVDAARDKILLGLEREGLVLSAEEWRLLAFHESGHAVVAAHLQSTDPVRKVTIVPRGRAMGVTEQLPERERYVHFEKNVRDRLAVMMGGRAAEQLVLDTRTTGAENDLKQGLRLARRMVLDWGMGPKLENLAFGDGGQPVFLGQEIAQGRDHSERTAREVDDAVRSLIDDALRCATTILERNRDGLERLADELIEEESVSGERVLEILGIDPEEADPGKRRSEVASG